MTTYLKIIISKRVGNIEDPKIYYRIYNVYPMIKKTFIRANELNVGQITGYFERTVTKFGNSAKIDCPKEFLGKRVFVIVALNESNSRTDIKNKGGSKNGTTE